MNLTPQQIINGMAEKNRMLTMKNEEYAELAEKRAQAERDYSVALAAKITQMRIDGNSVTLVKDLARGNKAVADLKMKLDIADGVLKACKGSIDNLRSSIDTYRSILSFQKLEMGNAGNS